MGPLVPWLPFVFLKFGVTSELFVSPPKVKEWWWRALQHAHVQAIKEKMKPTEVDDPCWCKESVTWQLAWKSMVVGYVQACMVHELREFSMGL